MAENRLAIMGEASYLAFCRALGHEPEEWDRLSCKKREAWRRAAIAVLDLRDSELEDIEAATPKRSNAERG